MTMNLTLLEQVLCPRRSVVIVRRTLLPKVMGGYVFACVGM